MADNLTENVAEVIGSHRYSLSDSPVHRCICGDDIGRDPEAIDRHRATKVVEALGLTREHRTLEDGYGVHGLPVLSRPCTRQSRYVTRWERDA